jgi:EmrB/QacA subfamily drug resistance transporter
MSGLCGLAPNPGVLIGGRALQAGFAALITPTSLALILPAFPPERRPFAIGTWGSMGALAAAVGPTLGALLVQYVDWRWIFLVNVPICGLVVLFGLRTLREGRDPHAQGLPDLLGVLLIGLMPAALSFAIIEGPSRGWTDARVLGAFALAVLLLPAFLWRCRAASRPAIDLALFRVRSFRLVNAATLVFSAAFYGTLLSNIIFLQTVWHYDVLRAALATSPGPLVVAVVARLSTRLAHVHGYRPILGIGGLCYAGGLAIYASSIGTHSAWAGHWLPAALLMGVGIGMTLPVQSSAAVRELPPARFAVGSGISASFRQLGAVIGISVYVALLGTPATAAAALAANQRVWWLFGALGLVAGLVVWLPRLWTPRPTPSSP